MSEWEDTFFWNFVIGLPAITRKINFFMSISSSITIPLVVAGPLFGSLCVCVSEMYFFIFETEIIIIIIANI